MMLSNSGYKKTPTVLQMEASECGAASLAMILSYYGQKVSLEQLRVETNVSRDGCKASNIVKAASARGYRCGGFRRTAEQLFGMDPPCIIFWEQNHFLVYEGVKGGNVYVNDPAFGERKLSKAEFINSYSGVVITLKPDEETAAGSKAKAGQGAGITGAVLEAAKARKAICAAVLILTACAAFACCAAAVSSGNPGSVLLLTAVFAASVLIRNIIVGTHQYKYTIIRSSAFMETLLALPMTFFEQRFPMDTAGRLSSEERVSRFASGAAFLMVSDAIIAIVTLIALPIADVRGGLAGIALIAAGFAGALLLSRDVSLEYNRQQVVRSRMGAKLFTAMGNSDMIKSTAGEDVLSREQADYQKEWDAGEETIEKRMLLSEGIVVVAEACAFLAAIAASGEHAGSAVVILLLFLVISLNGIAMRLTSQRGLLRDLARAGDVKEYLALNMDGRDDEANAETAVDPDGYKKLSGNIILDNVCFGYGRDDNPVIRDFSIKIDAGTCVGITGNTGSGKSTLLKLIAGLYEPDEGEIYFDKKKRSEIPARVLNTSIAFAMQKPQLVPGSIRDNISMWNPQIPEESIIRAAKDACIHEVIMDREAGYDSEVTENGSNFSGGQKQRIEIARALAIDPSIVLLDEVTSGLDRETAERVIRNIQKRGCTCLIASYQKSIIDSCDEVITI